MGREDLWDSLVLVRTREMETSELRRGRDSASFSSFAREDSLDCRLTADAIGSSRVFRGCFNFESPVLTSEPIALASEAIACFVFLIRRRKTAWRSTEGAERDVRRKKIYEALTWMYGWDVRSRLNKSNSTSTFSPWFFFQRRSIFFCRCSVASDMGR